MAFCGNEKEIMQHVLKMQYFSVLQKYEMNFYCCFPTCIHIETLVVCTAH